MNYLWNLKKCLSFPVGTYTVTGALVAFSSSHTLPVAFQTALIGVTVTIPCGCQLEVQST